MNQDNKFNQNNFNFQENNRTSNNQSLNNQNFNQGMNINQQTTHSFGQPTIQESTSKSINTFNSGSDNNSSFNSKHPKKINLGLIIGIVAVIAVVGVGIVFGSKLLSNGGSVNNSNNDSNSNINENNNKGNNNENKIDYETWGDSNIWIARKMGVDEQFAINFPKYSGHTNGKGLVAEQVDGTIVIVSAENDNSPAVDKLENFLPTYFSEIEYTLNSIYGILSENFEFNINYASAVTIGKYDMHTFNGTFSFDEDGDHYEYQYVVYVTQLKSNGAYAYWVVYDVSEDQSKGNLIKEHAYNMAQTFREDNLILIEYS